MDGLQFLFCPSNLTAPEVTTLRVSSRAQSSDLQVRYGLRTKASVPIAPRNRQPTSRRAVEDP